ncbi:MAG: hypothetical protein HQL22_11690 [Candidatus Omnitrophica bacterium]|nr:hypothetical protein [Candidatus Omnitrophota bacterium]
MSQRVKSESYNEYAKDIVRQFMCYRASFFKENQRVFDRPDGDLMRPPVFLPEYADMNILFHENMPLEVKHHLLCLISDDARHEWFRSMNSSQALAQSVFGNLSVIGNLNCLNVLHGDDGKPLFISGSKKSPLQMEYPVDSLGESKRTSLDVFIDGDYKVAVECKFIEDGVGPCSRPDVKKDDKKYLMKHCDGRYIRQHGRQERCSLTDAKIKYWEYVPYVFKWDVTMDHAPCPLLDTYQIVRNILAVCVTSDKKVNLKGGHVVLLYDARNPLFEDGGIAWQKVKEALRERDLLQKCTWQEVVAAMRNDKEISWLTDLLKAKYGF